MYAAKADKASDIMSNRTGMFSVWKSHRRYPEKLRKIKYADLEAKKEFIFLTSNFEPKATDIACCTGSAGKTQIYCAIIIYCLVSILAKDLKIDHPIYEILPIPGISLLDKIPVKELLTNTDYKNIKEQDYNLLLFN